MTNKFDCILTEKDFCPFPEGNDEMYAWREDMCSRVQDMLDALRQWRRAEMDKDEKELENARQARDSAIFRMLGELK